MTGQQRKVAGLTGAFVVAGVVALVAIPGGSSHDSAGSAGPASSAGTTIAPAPAPAGVPASGSGTDGSTTSGESGSGDGRGSYEASRASDADDSTLAATRVVRTGQLSLLVSGVTSAVARLTSMASSAGGYVQSSTTTTSGGVPEGDITLRVPSGQFDAAVAGAQRLGRTTSLTTSATDVTGRYVDLVARASALRRTRATYLSILSTARTIGATLSVQQRVQDVQQQLDQIEGERKVLAAQSDDATLAVSLSQRHAKRVSVPPASSGIGAAWHRSVHRFSVGLDAIVGTLGPLLLALLLLAILAGIGLIGYRGARRVMS